MRLYFTGFISLLLLISCHSQKTSSDSFNEFEFSYSYGGSYSIKFTHSDTIYVARYFPLPIKTFRGIITSFQKLKIDSFIYTIPFQKLDTLYYEPYADGGFYQFYIKTDSLKKRIFVGSYNRGPRELNNFAAWIVKMQTELTLFKTDTTIKFINNSDFNPPIPPKINDTIKYTTPKVLYPE